VILLGGHTVQFNKHRRRHKFRGKWGGVMRVACCVLRVACCVTGVSGPIATHR
jgi:hypothetical protein